MKKLLILLMLYGSVSFAQELKIRNNQGGLFSLGIRSTTSIFEHNNFGVQGFGYGGQMRVQLANRLNTEWYFDYMRGSIDQVVNRTDYHVGWSVMYYFTAKLAPPVKPYIVAGHCFDRTELYENANRGNSISKGSSAIQAGAGCHFNLSPRMDITLLAQYMFHLGKDVHAHIHEGEPIEFESHKGTGIEGHLLLNVGINYKIADLWASGKKRK